MSLTLNNFYCFRGRQRYFVGLQLERESWDTYKRSTYTVFQDNKILYTNIFKTISGLIFIFREDIYCEEKNDSWYFY